MISQEPPREAVAPLPVSQGIALLYATLLRHFSALLARLLLPMAVSVVFLLLLVLQLPQLIAHILWYLFLALPVTLLAASWLRLLLLEKDDSALGAIFDFGPRHRRLLRYTFLLSLITLPMVILQYWMEAGSLALEPVTPGQDGFGNEAGYGHGLGDGNLMDLAFWAVYMPLYYVQLRLSFVLPAAAVDEHYSFADSWRHTESQSGRLFAIAVIALLGPWLVWYYSPSLSEAPLWQLFAFVFHHFMIFLHQGAFLAFMAIAFRTCTGWVPAPDRSLIERFE